MIGEMQVAVSVQPRTGDRVDAIANVRGPGDTDYNVPISITGTIQAIWGIPDSGIQAALEVLIRELFTIIGTSAKPPVNGFWFDSYNSDVTIQETLNRVRNFGQTSFLKDPTPIDQISRTFGGGILSEIERIDGIVFQRTGLRFAGTLDYAFVRSEAEQDLGSPPADNAGLLYRICILSVIIDGFRIKLPGEAAGSLKALENWLADKVGITEARRMTEPFARVKDLRKQYPLHEHFITDTTGQLVVREEVDAANGFFAFRPHDDVTAKWKNITDSFKVAVADVGRIIDEL
jgi:hypothetical protein